LPAGRHHLLNETDPVSLVGPELLGGEQEAHRVAPAELARRPDRRAAERHDSPADLQLAEPDVVGADDDVAGQRQLDGQREGDALHRQDDRLGDRLLPQPVGVVLPRPGEHLGTVLLHRGEHLGEVQAGGEVVTVSEQDPDARFVVVGQLVVRCRHSVDHRQVPGVALGGPVDADQQHVAAAFDRDQLRCTTGRGIGCTVGHGTTP
jgi:hypothetical protein